MGKFSEAFKRGLGIQSQRSSSRGPVTLSELPAILCRDEEVSACLPTEQELQLLERTEALEAELATMARKHNMATARVRQLEQEVKRSDKLYLQLRSEAALLQNELQMSRSGSQTSRPSLRASINFDRPNDVQTLSGRLGGTPRLSLEPGEHSPALSVAQLQRTEGLAKELEQAQADAEESEAKLREARGRESRQADRANAAEAQAAESEEKVVMLERELAAAHELLAAQPLERADDVQRPEGDAEWTSELEKEVNRLQALVDRQAEELLRNSVEAASQMTDLRSHVDLLESHGRQSSGRQALNASANRHPLVQVSVAAEHSKAKPKAQDLKPGSRRNSARMSTGSLYTKPKPSRRSEARVSPSTPRRRAFFSVQELMKQRDQSGGLWMEAMCRELDRCTSGRAGNVLGELRTRGGFARMTDARSGFSAYVCEVLRKDPQAKFDVSNAIDEIVLTRRLHGSC